MTAKTDKVGRQVASLERALQQATAERDQAQLDRARLLDQLKLLLVVAPEDQDPWGLWACARKVVADVDKPRG